MAIGLSKSNCRNHLAFRENNTPLPLEVVIVQNAGRLYGNKEEDLGWQVWVTTPIQPLLTEAFTNLDACKRYAEHHVKLCYENPVMIWEESDLKWWAEDNNDAEHHDWIGKDIKLRIENPVLKEQVKP